MDEWIRRHQRKETLACEYLSRPFLEVLLMGRFYLLRNYIVACVASGVLFFFFNFLCLYIQLIKTDSGIGGLHKLILGIDYITNQYDAVRLYDTHN